METIGTVGVTLRHSHSIVLTRSVSPPPKVHRLLEYETIRL